MTSQCQGAEGLGAPSGLGAPQGRQGRAHPTAPARSRAGRERPGTAPALGIQHLPGDRAGPRKGWNIGPRVEVSIRPSEGNQGETQTQDV